MESADQIAARVLRAAARFGAHPEHAHVAAPEPPVEPPSPPPVHATHTPRAHSWNSHEPPPPFIHDDTLSETISEAGLPSQDPAVALRLAEPSPLLKLGKVLGFSGDTPRNVLWMPDGTRLIFSCSSTVIVMEVAPREEAVRAPRAGGGGGGAQQLLFGHTAPVSAMALQPRGNLLATVQEGKHPLVRVWNVSTMRGVALFHPRCTATWTLDWSLDGRFLAFGGRDHQARPALTLWDMLDVPEGGDPRLVARHVSPFDIRRVLFSPFEDSRIVTCGRENVRLYRLKEGKLRDVGVPLGSHGPGRTFLDVGFEGGYRALNVDDRRMFACTDDGCVYQVNYASRALECVYRLHDGAINALAVNDGFCVTASDDKFLRVWPLDFSDSLMEAEHEGPVTAACASFDSLRVAVGCENGALGILDVPTHEYRTVLRSHVDSVYDVAIDPNPNRNEFATVSADGTIRVWSADIGEQLYEFDCPGDIPRSAAYHPRVHLLAVGFESGTVRILDVANTGVLQEFRQHKGRVLQLVYTPDGERLYSASEDGNVCAYDPTLLHRPVKMLASMRPTALASIAVSPDSSRFACVGPDCACIVLFDAKSLTEELRIAYAPPAAGPRRRPPAAATCVGPPPAVLVAPPIGPPPLPDAGFARIAFSPCGEEIVAVTLDGRLQRFTCRTGSLLSEAHRAHTAGCEALAVSPDKRLIATGGGDRMVRLWPYGLSRAPQAPCPRQTFMGHPGPVTRAAFSRDGGRLVTAGTGCGLLVYDLEAVPPRHHHSFRERSGVQPPSAVRGRAPSSPDESLEAEAAPVVESPPPAPHHAARPRARAPPPAVPAPPPPQRAVHSDPPSPAPAAYETAAASPPDGDEGRLSDSSYDASSSSEAAASPQRRRRGARRGQPEPAAARP